MSFHGCCKPDLGPELALAFSEHFNREIRSEALPPATFRDLLEPLIGSAALRSSRKFMGLFPCPGQSDCCRYDCAEPAGASAAWPRAMAPNAFEYTLIDRINRLVRLLPYFIKPGYSMNIATFRAAC